VVQFRHLSSQCHFPWLLANVLDPALGADVPIANCGKMSLLTSSNGIKIGVIGLGEREWYGFSAMWLITLLRVLTLLQAWYD
jgi:2',3'-cyclic-nucleotide 2'-phosphodiesterase (5'-nucleotidase family)